MSATSCTICAKNVVRVLTYGRNLKNSAHRISSIRRYSNSQKSDGGSSGVRSFETETGSGWPDELLGPVTPKNHKFPLPGNTNVLPCDLLTPNNSLKISSPSEMLEESSNSEKHLGALSHFIAESNMIDDDVNDEYEIKGIDIEDGDISDSIIRNYFKDATVELAIQDCPKLLQKDFKEIFLEMPKNEGITVITITQKTANDMSGWNESVHTEREHLLKSFMTTATEVCHLLRANNFWSDFVDPSSGQAYFGPYTNSTLYETDERYNQLGFDIDDLGCCRVITHNKWGSNVFVGCVVTNAHTDHNIIKRLLGAI